MRKIILLILLLVGVSAFAANDVYQFHSSEQQHRFYNLTKDLRCLVCQNQNLAESNAGLAKDLRDEIYVKVNTGFSDEQILHYLVARYGNFILYKPPVSTATLVLWFAPLLFLLSALSLLFFYLYHTRKHTLKGPRFLPSPNNENSEPSIKIGEGIW